MFALSSSHTRYDPRHWLGILLTIAVSKVSLLFPVFAVACSMCLFKPMKGEYGRVLAHLKYERPGISAAEISAVSWHYFRKLMRQVCPAPLIIMCGIRDVCVVFSNMIDPETLKPFFIPGWRKPVDSQIAHQF